MRVGLIGTGFGAKVHLPGWRSVDGVEVVAVCSSDGARAQRVADRFGIARAYDDPQALIADPDVELVDVCTHADTHHDLALASLEAGRHLLCEKPLALDAAQTGELVAAAAARPELVAAVCFEHRYQPARRLLRDLVADGRVGTPRMVVGSVLVDMSLNPESPAYYHGPYALRASAGGVLSQVVVHYLDLIMSVFGDIEGVRGRLATTVPERPVAVGPPPRTGDDAPPDRAIAELRAVDADDCVALHGTLPGGGLVSMVGSWAVHHGSGPRIEAHGSAGSVLLTPDGTVHAGRAGEPSAPVPLPDGYRVDGEGPGLVGVFARLAADLHAAVESGGRVHPPLLPTLADGHRVQLLVDAILADGA
jgi:predicted dehydrogenase